MLRNIQTIDSAIQTIDDVRVNQVRRTRCADAHAPKKHSFRGKRLSGLAPARPYSGLPRPEYGTESGMSMSERRPVLSTAPLAGGTIRPAGDPPAAIWATLVIHDAMSC